MDNILSITNIRKRFNNNGHSRTILSNVSFDISNGQFVSLIGPSGCGKTTLLSIIAGFQNATSGKVILNGAAVTKPGPERGFVFQDFALFPWMTLKQNILFPMKQQKIPRTEQEKRLKNLLSMAKLEGFETYYPNQISGGMKQRAAFIRALAGNPKVLLMDEPLSAVDYQMRRILQEELETLWLKHKTTVMMVTHDVEEAVYLSDRVIVMSVNKGEIVDDISIGIARPRDRNRNEYTQYINQLTELLKIALISKKENNKSYES